MREANEISLNHKTKPLRKRRFCKVSEPIETESAMPTSRFVSTMVFALFFLSVACQVNAEEKGSTYYDLGVFSYESGDYETAEKNLTKALELNPGHPPYHHYLGKTYLKMARYDEAMKHLNQAWSVDPDMTELKYDMAYGYLQLEDYARAAELFRQAAAEDPNNVLAHYYGGISLYREKKYKESINYFLTAAKRSPTVRVNGHYYAGLSYLKTGEIEKATKELEYVRDNAKIGYQYDDNVRYEPLDEDIFSNEDDFFTSIDLLGRYNFVNRTDWKLSAGYYHYQSLYNRLDEYDLVESVPSISVKYQMDPLMFGLNYYYYYYWIDYQRYLRRHRLIPDITWNVTDNFSTRLKYSYYDNEHFQDNRYDGDNHEVSFLVDYRHLVDEKEIILIGEIGYEDNNATHPDEYYNRVKVRGSVYFMGPWQTKIKLTARYEDKTYDNTNSFFDKKREDDKYIGSILIAHRFFHDLIKIQTEYSYTKNNSNISYYEYERNVVGLYLTLTY